MVSSAVMGNNSSPCACALTPLEDLMRLSLSLSFVAALAVVLKAASSEGRLGYLHLSFCAAQVAATAVLKEKCCMPDT